MNTLGAVASAVGKGLVAGFVGTAAMTMSRTIKMQLRQREPSLTPANAAREVLGVKPVDEAAKIRFNAVWGIEIVICLH
jgi:hypothetical protein